KNQVLKIDDNVGFHPSLQGFARLLDEQQLAIVQGVGYPNPNRSHFESMDIWHTAQQHPDKQQGGWIGRALDAQHEQWKKQSDTPALHLGDEAQPLALTARDVATPSVRSLERFKLETSGDDSRRSMIQTTTQLPRSQASDLLKFV